MSTRLTLVLIASLIASRANGQLFLLTGSPTPKYNQTFASALLQVEEDGSVRTVAELVPADVGTDWIGVSYDLSKAVFAPGSKYPIVVVNLDEATVVKQCEPPPVVGGGSLIEQWLADVPGGGPMYAEYIVGNLSKVVRSMILDPSIPCEESFVDAAPTEIRYLVAHGMPGVADLVPDDGTYVRIDQSGRITKLLRGSWVSFDYQIPAAFRNPLDQAHVTIITNNSKLLTLGMVDKDNNYRIMVLRKNDNTWRVLPVRSERFPNIRGFGSFLAITELHAKNSKHADSAGRAEWRKADSKMGPNIEERFRNDRDVYPGRLHMYDAHTGRIYTIATNQGDSEILLIENDTVYYRASDRLYAAPITGKELGPARLLATSDLVRDAHWAFLKH